MPADSDDDALANIEADLSSDRSFTRRLAWAQAGMGKRDPSWRSLGASALLLSLAAVLLIADVRLNQPWLMFPCVAVFAVAMRPVMISMSRKEQGGGNDRKR